MSHCFHVQNQHTDTFLAPAVDMLVILAPPHPPKRQNHQRIGSQFNRHDAGSVSSAANSTVTMSVAYRQRLNGPNVKSTSGSTAGCSEFVVLLRGPGEQPGSARAEQHTNIIGAAHHRRGAIRSYNSPSLGFWTNSVSERAEVIGRPAAAAFKKV